MDTIDRFTLESTASNVKDKMESIMIEINIYRTRLQKAKESGDQDEIKRICIGCIKEMKLYYKEIEDIPENVWENLAFGIGNSVLQLAGLAFSIANIVDAVSSASSINIKTGASITNFTANGLAMAKNFAESVKYTKINNKNLGNRNRKVIPNITKEWALKTINDTIILMQRSLKSL